MKVKTLSALAGAASVLAAGTAQAAPTVGFISNTTDPFLVANGLQSAIIQIQGLAPGETVQGFLGTPTNPWDISTTSASGFFNLSGQFGTNPTSPSFDGATSFYAATPGNAPGSGPAGTFDSGLLGNPAVFGEPTGNPGSGIGGFALSGDGSSDSNITPAAWITLSPSGFDPPLANYSFLRITWAANESAHIGGVLAMNTPAGEIKYNITIPAVPAPGALALLGLAGLVGARRRRN
jgi:MYXO-CTERM domain-containing protein